MILRIILILFAALLGAIALPGLAAENNAEKNADCCPFELNYVPYRVNAGPEFGEKVGNDSALKIGAGKVFGSYWTHANWLKKQSKQVVPVETEGPLHNLGEVLQGKVILGYSSLSMMRAVEAALGSAPGSTVESTVGSAVGSPAPVLCLAFPLYETPLSWVMLQNQEEQAAAADRLQPEALHAKVQSLSDLPLGFGLGIGPEYSSTDWVFRRILSILGKDLTLSTGTWVGLHQQFEQRLISGLAYAAGIPNPQIKRLFRKSESNTMIHVLGFTPKEMDLIQNQLHLHPYTILENTYQNQINPINSASFWNYAITQCQINSEQIYELTRLAMSESSVASQAEQTPISAQKAKFWSQTWGIPFHPGAIQFFKEQGIDLSQKN